MPIVTTARPPAAMQPNLPTPPADLDALGHLLMDQEKLDARIAAQERRFHTRTMPRLRAGAFVLALGLAALHNSALFGEGWGIELTALASALAVYALASTALVRRSYGDGTGPSYAEHLAWIDVFFAGALVYATGGPKSLLFFLPYARAFETSPGRSARRFVPLFLAPVMHAGALAASAMIGGAQFALWVEVTKVAACTLTGAYFMFGAESAQRVWRRQSTALGYARELVGELRAQSDALEESKRTAEGHARAKWASLTDVSHGLRAPAERIIDETEAALAAAREDGQEVHLSAALSSARRLLANVEGVHRFSTLEAGKVAPQHAPFRLRDALALVLRTPTERARAKGLEVVCDVARDVPEAVVGDARSLTEILDELLSNAARFTGEGSVLLRVEAGRAGWIAFSVVDTGVGISAEELELVFDPFASAERSTARRFGGAGLGLAIAKRLAEMLGGGLSATSVEGSGSTFTALLPLEETAGERSRAARPQPLPEECRAGDVLVIAERELTRETLVRRVEEFGRTARAARSKSEAYAVAARGSGALAAVVCDRTLDPLERAAIDSALGGALDWVIVDDDDAAASDGDAIPSLRFHRVAPPVVGPELFEALERATRPRGPLPALDGLARVEARPDRSPTDRAGSASARPMQRTRRPLQVLLVEDDAVNQRVGRLLLESWGHRVEVAAHGRAAVERTGAHEFDAVLMDVDMPEMDGLEATRAVRAREARTGSAPAFLVAMTGRNLEHDRVACREAGMDEHIAKPVDRGELFALLERRGSALERQS